MDSDGRSWWCHRGDPHTTPGLSRARGGAPLLYLAMFYVYALEVYFDFSGYTDMARATARALGFEIPENFRQPWRAESPIDWWRRWHISLATFLRDYVHYPLFFRTKNLFLCTSVTFMLNGIWHEFHTDPKDDHTVLD